jgi:ribosomal-protein-alanine N-acetyltransferase
MITVRIATESDYAGIARIQARAPQAAQWPLGDYSGTPMLVAAVEGEHAGFCAWRQTMEDEAELLNIAVDPDFRRRGVGEALLAELVRTAKGCIFLEVSEANPSAEALYRKCGWEAVSVRRGYYDQGRANAIVMKKCSW